MRIKPIIYIVVMVFFITSFVPAEDGEGIDGEIQFIIDHVKNSSLIFIRNGKEHSAQEA